MARKQNIRLRRDTASNWTSVNPILASGEPGLETDTRRVKYGDGTTAWNSLSYTSVAESDVTGLVADLALKAPLVSPALTGAPTAPTASAGDNSTKLATTAYVDSAAGIKRLVVTSSGNFTAGSAASTDYIYLISANHTPTLPTAVGNTNRYTFKNNHSANITFAFTSTQTADGGSLTIAPSESVDLISNNTNWNII